MQKSYRRRTQTANSLKWRRAQRPELCGFTSHGKPVAKLVPASQERASGGARLLSWLALSRHLPPKAPSEATLDPRELY